MKIQAFSEDIAKKMPTPKKTRCQGSGTSVATRKRLAPARGDGP
jgi:hypothetical protein